ncbi:MAG: PilZ domain-containing protein [Kangiellaceae bacterium]|nr:PilZ domain-containing protein [Kangiellaceae bacterium]MCW8999058.1 PilZ domain-containing protein [Kangiellaceae bacterium]
MTDYLEQRRHKRLPLRTNVFVEGDGFSRFRTQTMDFSDGGLFVEGQTLAKLDVNTLIHIQTAEDIEDAPLLTARIAWTNRYGAGIEYLLDS